MLLTVDIILLYYTSYNFLHIFPMISITYLEVKTIRIHSFDYNLLRKVETIIRYADADVPIITIVSPHSWAIW